MFVQTCVSINFHLRTVYVQLSKHVLILRYKYSVIPHKLPVPELRVIWGSPYKTIKNNISLFYIWYKYIKPDK